MGKFTRRPIVYDPKEVDYLISLGFDVEFAQLLNSRGVSANNINEYIDDNFFYMHDPYRMLNMDKAVSAIKTAIESNHKILIYGDYDADGLTATAILKLFLDSNKVINDVYIPTREDGYGLHVDLLLDKYRKEPFDLLITVDCGISNKAEIAEIENKIGIKVVVTDHHELPEDLPNCICINCKMGYPFAYLSGAGVALKLVEALSDRETALKYVDLAMVGTIADMMPLEDENRQIVKFGLKNMSHRGLLKLAEVTKCDKQLTASSMALKICPKINSAGRVGVPYKALDLLLMSERATQEAVKALLDCNALRQNLLEGVISEANDQVANLDFTKEKMLFLHGESWPKGILGIGANRFKEIFKKPVAFLTKDGDEYIGSARSNDDINLHGLFSSVSDLLVRFGGHKGSVGFSVLKSNLVALKERINLELSNYVAKPIQTYYDLHFSSYWLEQKNYEKLSCLEPYLPNDKPIFYLEDFCTSVGTFGNGNLKFTLGCGLEIKAFGASCLQFLRPLKTGAECRVCFYLEVDKYTNKLFGSLVDIELKNSLQFDELYASNYFARLVTKEKISPNKIGLDQAREILSFSNVAVVFNSYLDYEYAKRYFTFDEYSLEFFCQKTYSDRLVIISPDKMEYLSRYKNILVFANYEDYNLDFGDNVFYVDLNLPTPSYINALDIFVDRRVCIEVFNAISVCKIEKYYLHDFFDNQFFYCNRMEFFASIAIFRELGLIEIINEKIIKVNFDKKNLTDSSLFNKLNKRI